MKRRPLLNKVKIVLAVIGLLYFGLFNSLEPTEVGIAWDAVSGKKWLQTGGAHFTPPWVLVSRIDTRPCRVGVYSGGHGFSTMLVQFDKTHWLEFVNTEGFDYYWWSNRISFNWSYDEEHRGMKDILRGYAYSAKRYPFIKVLTEYQDK